MPTEALGATGKIDSGFGNSLHLTDEETEALDAIVERHRRALGDQLPERTRYDAFRSDQGVKSVYHIHALPDRGKAFWEDLNKELTANIGVEKARLLVAGIASSYDFANFGRSDAEVIVTFHEGGPSYEINLFDARGNPSASLHNLTGRMIAGKFGPSFAALILKPRAGG